MFGNRRNRTQKAERLAGQAWENLSAAVDAAGHSTRSARRRATGLIEDTSDRVGSSARRARSDAKSGVKEARRRANAAYDALAGRKPSTPWGLITMVAAIGVVAGWLANLAGRRLAPTQNELMSTPATFDEDLPVHR